MPAAGRRGTGLPTSSWRGMGRDGGAGLAPPVPWRCGVIGRTGLPLREVVPGRAGPPGRGTGGGTVPLRETICGFWPVDGRPGAALWRGAGRSGAGLGIGMFGLAAAFGFLAASGLTACGFTTGCGLTTGCCLSADEAFWTDCFCAGASGFRSERD